jgi:two-component system, chemotaxis family, CheB/CheR fusion protein
VEDLQSANEELMSINEEQKAAAEELETSREEIQSINEELTTINQEHQSTIEEVKRTNADLQNLIESTEIGTIFLDRACGSGGSRPRSRSCSTSSPTDQGRPLAHITHRLDYAELVADAPERAGHAGADRARGVE